ncbi:AAA family ATPase [Thioclava marina]|nr:AAA family ATPase [Thioclava marina]
MEGNPTTDGQHVVLSGCSGGGKSTLLAELASRGFETVEEPAGRSCCRS